MHLFCIDTHWRMLVSPLTLSIRRASAGAAAATVKDAVAELREQYDSQVRVICTALLCKRRLLTALCFMH